MTAFGQRRRHSGRSLTRRVLLARGLAFTSALATAALLPETAGCTLTDPLVDAPGPAPSASSSGTSGAGHSSAGPAPTPPASAGPAIAGEQALADLATAILAGPHRAQLPAAQGRTLTAVRDGHRQHVALLGTPAGPAGPSRGPSAALATLSVQQSIQMLAGREQQQATRLRRDALAADGAAAFVRGSMMVAATGYAQALRGQRGIASVGSTPPDSPVAAVSDVAALQSVVRQLHALVYGYQVALGQLSESSPAGRRALAALAARRGLRDRLADILLSRSAAAPAAAGAYAPSPQPTTARMSQVLIQRMETAFEPFCGRWLASAARPEDRRLALEALAYTTAAAQDFGAAVKPWPGSPS